MSEIAAKRQPESAVAVRSEVLTKDLEAKAASLGALQEEVRSATGPDKNRLLFMIKNETIAVAGARRNFDSFVNAIALPQLKLAGISVWFHPDNAAFDVYVWVQNDGILPSLGSFELDLSVTYISDYSQSPPLYADGVFPMTTPDSTDIQPGVINTFVFQNIPFIPQPGTGTARFAGTAVYTFDVLLFAGPDGVVGDDTLHSQMLLRPPRITRPFPLPPALKV